MKTNTEIKAITLENVEVEVTSIETKTGNGDRGEFTYNIVKFKFDGGDLSGTAGTDIGLKQGKQKVDLEVKPTSKETLKFKIYPGSPKTLGAS